MAVRLTKRVVDATEPSRMEKLIFDSDVSGFGLKVTPAGKKVYLLQYRMGGRGTPTRRVTIGEHGSDVTPDQARDEAIRLRGLIKHGIDPYDQRKAAQAKHAKATEAPPDTVERVVAEFIKRYLSQNRSGAETARILSREVVPAWKGRRLSEIKRGDIVRLLDGIADRGAVYARNRTGAAIRKLCNWALQRDIIDSNPAARLEMLDEEKRDRVLSDDELRRVWHACDDLGWPFGPLFRLLVLTAQRRDEVGTMRWDEINTDAALWTIPKEKAKNGRVHEVPLSPAALAVLADLPRTGEYVFTTNSRTPVSGFSKAKTRLDTLAADAAKRDGEGWRDDWKLHDVRRTVATNMAKLGVAPHIVEKILNHATGTISGMAAVYNRHAYLDERRRALDAWARQLETILGQPGNNIVPLRA
jgi:integrase